MDIEEKLYLATRNTEEVITLEDLRLLFETETSPKGYIGVEPSGLHHTGWIIWVEKVKDLIEAGVDMHVFWATWHAKVNDKLGGDIDIIKKCAKYLEHCLFSLGLDKSKIKFDFAEIIMDDLDYWGTVLKVARYLTLARIKRALTILGRTAEDAEMDFSKMLYPLLQVTDIFKEEYKVCLGGMDQRRAHILARDIADKLTTWKPVGIHTPLLSGLTAQTRMEAFESYEEFSEEKDKMSKSKPESAILIHDSPEAVKRKIDNAFCPPKQIEGNPIVEINRFLFFSKEDFTLFIDREQRYGGPIEIHSFSELKELYRNGKLHPQDLKNVTSTNISKRLAPVREYFKKNIEAAKLLEEMKQLTITR